MKKTVLVVDDEQVIRNLAKNILIREGFEVLLAESGAQACEIVSRGEDPIDLVILDLVMPGMDGKETYERIQETSPGIPAIFASGYGTKAPPLEVSSSDRTGFVPKPYDIDTLMNEVRRLLQAPDGSS